MTTDALVKEINTLHGENVEAAMSTAQRAMNIGIKLQQLKETLDHGEFEKLADAKIKVSSKCRSNYMRLAEERLIEEHAMKLLAAKSHGGKSVSVTDLTIEQVGIPAPVWEQAAKEVGEMSWLKLPFKAEQLIKSIKGKELGTLYRDYGIIRDPKTRGTHERTPKDLRKEIEAAGECDDSMCKEWCSNTLMLLEETTNTLGGQKTATLQKMENLRLQLGHRIQKILKGRGAKTKGAL